MTGDGMDPLTSMADTARVLNEQPTAAGTLQKIVDLAVETVPGAEYADLALVGAKKRVETVAVTDELCTRVDQVQYDTGEGPCLDAVWDSEAVLTQDLEGDQRWPRFGPQAVALGVRSVAAFRLLADGGYGGSLNLFSSAPDAFCDNSLRIGRVFVAHAAMAYAHADEVERLQRAIATRTVIGQAQGVLIAQYLLTDKEAFALLRTASQHRNVKLRDVAQEVVDTGKLVFDRKRAALD